VLLYLAGPGQHGLAGDFLVLAPAASALVLAGASRRPSSGSRAGRSGSSDSTVASQAARSSPAGRRSRRARAGCGSGTRGESARSPAVTVGALHAQHLGERFLVKLG
jgi:hypothetical protein